MDDLVVEAKVMCDALVRTKHARSKKLDRPVLFWHWLIPWDGGLDVMASDNYRVARYRLTAVGGSTTDWPTCLLDPEDADLLAVWLKGCDTATLHVADDVLVVSADGPEEVRFRLRTGAVPDIGQVAVERTTSIRFVPKYIAEAAKFSNGVYGSTVTTLTLGGPLSPIVIENEDYTEFVMPVRDLA